MTRYTTIDSPVGTLLAVGDETGALTHLHMAGQRYGVTADPSWTEVTREGDRGAGRGASCSSRGWSSLGEDPDGFAAVRTQLAEYFAGERREFELPLAPAGTPFQQKIWETVRAIPFGTTTTYGAIAAATGSAPRAVGAAVGRNPIGIVVPCHRVIGATGALTGYAGGLDRKRRLLAHEGAALVA